MSRKLIAAAVLMATVACADPDAVTSPDVVRSPAGNPSVATCTAEQGQQFIDASEYKKAIQEFTCVIGLDPTAVEGYRGRIEAQLMLGLFSDALRDYTRVTAFVLPVHPEAQQAIIAGYQTYLTRIQARTAALKRERKSEAEVVQIITDEMAAQYPDQARLGGAIRAAYAEVR